MKFDPQLASAYFKLLTSVDWNDSVLVSGLREGLNKFLSNAHLACSRAPKHHKTHFISRAALRILNSGETKGLVFEHVVPKTRYIQTPCEKLARLNKLTIADIELLLEKYWALASITKEEDKRLHRTAMPEDWDLVDVMARYRAVDIELEPNPFYPKSIDGAVLEF